MESLRNVNDVLSKSFAPQLASPTSVTSSPVPMASGEVPEPAGGAVLAETFAMPNPVGAQETAGFHYRD